MVLKPEKLVCMVIVLPVRFELCACPKSKLQKKKKTSEMKEKFNFYDVKDQF